MGGFGGCCVCGAPLDREGRCTRVNEFFHVGKSDPADDEELYNTEPVELD
jgi:hypothetical protein